MFVPPDISRPCSRRFSADVAPDPELFHSLATLPDLAYMPASVTSLQGHAAGCVKACQSHPGAMFSARLSNVVWCGRFRAMRARTSFMVEMHIQMYYLQDSELQGGPAAR